MTPDERLRELAVRHAAFGWLDRQRAAGTETFTQESTSDLTLAGETVRLMPTQQGIWKPGMLAAALAVRTVFRSEGSDRPYDDAVGLDGFYRYKMRGTDPNHFENRALLEAMLEEFIARRARAGITEAFGTLEWDGSYDYKEDRRSGDVG